MQTVHRDTQSQSADPFSSNDKERHILRISKPFFFSKGLFLSPFIAVSGGVLFNRFMLMILVIFHIFMMRNYDNSTCFHVGVANLAF